MSEEKLPLREYSIAFTNSPVSFGCRVFAPSQTQAVEMARKCLNSDLFCRDISRMLDLGYYSLRFGSWNVAPCEPMLAVNGRMIGPSSPYLRDQMEHGVVKVDFAALCGGTYLTDRICLSSILDGHFELDELPVDFATLCEELTERILEVSDVENPESEVWDFFEDHDDLIRKAVLETPHPLLYSSYLGQRAAHELGSWEKVEEYLEEAPRGSRVPRNVAYNSDEVEAFRHGAGQVLGERNLGETEVER